VDEIVTQLDAWLDERGTRDLQASTGLDDLHLMCTNLSNLSIKDMPRQF